MNARHRNILRLGGTICAFAILLGCAEKKPTKPSTQFVLPTNCIIGALVDVGKCKQVGNDQAICDGMVVRFACVKVK